MFEKIHLNENQKQSSMYLDYNSALGAIKRAAKLLDKVEFIPLSTNYTPKKIQSIIERFPLTTMDKKPFKPLEQDAILIDDVLDHMESGQVEYLKNTNAKIIYVRCHPWISRNGSHHESGRAFAHLIFNSSELKQDDKFFKTISPDRSYRNWFAEAGYSVIYSNFDYEAMEPIYFEDSYLKERIFNFYRNKNNAEFAFVTLSKTYYYYILKQHTQPIILMDHYKVAVFNHYIDNRLIGTNHFYSNGKINSRDSSATWKIEDDVLTMQWPYPGGEWIDTCNISKNRLNYSGKNNNGLAIRGELNVNFRRNEE